MPSQNKGTEPGGPIVDPRQLAFHAPPQEGAVGGLEEEPPRRLVAEGRETPVKQAFRLLLASWELQVERDVEASAETDTELVAAIAHLNVLIRRMR